MIFRRISRLISTFIGASFHDDTASLIQSPTTRCIFGKTSAFRLTDETKQCRLPVCFDCLRRSLLQLVLGLQETARVFLHGCYNEEHEHNVSGRNAFLQSDD